MVNKKQSIFYCIVGGFSLLSAVCGIVSLIILKGSSPYLALPIIAIVVGGLIGAFDLFAFLKKRPLRTVFVGLSISLNVLALAASAAVSAVYHKRTIGDYLEVENLKTTEVVVELPSNEGFLMTDRDVYYFLPLLSKIEFTWDPFFDLNVASSYRIKIKAEKRDYLVDLFGINDGNRVVHFRDAENEIRLLIERYAWRYTTFPI